MQRTGVYSGTSLGENRQSSNRTFGSERDASASIEPYNLPSDQSWIIIVRPDGVVGARVLEVDGVERYFQKIFS